MIWIDFDPVKHEGKPLYESVSRETEIDGETARVFEVVPAKVSFKVASETPWFYMVEIEETGDVWEESAGPGWGWWGPPIGTHGTGREKDSSGYAGGGESRAGNAKTIAKGDDTELYRWGNLTDVHSSFLGKRTRSLDMTDRPEWYFAPPSMLKSDSWVETVYGRYLLDRPTLAKAGWSKDPHLKVEGAWRWKPGNLGKGWQDIDDKFVGNSFLSSIKGYEVVSLPKGIKTEMLGDWFTYRTGRKIPITLTSVSNITDPFTEAGPSQHEEE